jgi:hypothetical protein
MRFDLQTLLALLAAGLLFGGCAESQRPEATGKGSIRAVHALPTAPDINFLIEERSLGTLSYKGSTNAQPFDDLTYNFNFDARVPGDNAVSRVASRTLDVVAGTDYVFALTGTLTDPAIVLWESPERAWSGSETVLEASAGHLAPSVAELDVYLAPPGTAPAAGQARGSLAFGDKLPPFEFENGDYVLILTAAGDPSNVLFISPTQDLAERTSLLFTIQDADPSITSGISVQRVTRDGASIQLGDAGVRPTRRFIHAALGTGNLDVVVDDDFAAPVVSDLAYGAVSADVPVPVATSNYSLTQAGNPGAVLHEEENAVVTNTRSTTYIAGEPGDLELVSFTDNRRALAGLAKVRLTLVSTSFEEADLYLLEAGSDIADVPPSFVSINSRLSTGYLQLVPDSYELTVTVAGEKTVAAGPLALDLTDGSITDLAIIDTPDPAALNIVGVGPP